MQRSVFGVPDSLNPVVTEEIMRKFSDGSDR